MQQKAAKLFRERQTSICATLEELDGTTHFLEDVWERADTGGGHGGGGKTCVLQKGTVFEQAGVNFSEVHGTLPKSMSSKLVGSDKREAFYATGVSLVLHPQSPMVPTTHANFRYLEVADKSWFGGGLDLTPYYFFEEDAIHFHQSAKQACDKHDPTYYPRFKKWCDEYFYLPHRNEARGIGGLFFDYIGKEKDIALNSAYEFVVDCSAAFLEAYVPIVQKRMQAPFSEQQKHFQLLRRGRYVEFNLLHDRGTQFGLETGGRTESILMSLPPNVKWEYCYTPESGSDEEKLLHVVQTPRDWV